MFNGNYTFVFDFDGLYNQFNMQEKLERVVEAIGRLKQINEDNRVWILTTFIVSNIRTTVKEKFPTLYRLIDRYVSFIPKQELDITKEQPYLKSIKGKSKLGVALIIAKKLDAIRTDNPNHKIIYFTSSPENLKIAAENKFTKYNIKELSEIGETINNVITYIVNDVVWYDNKPNKIMTFQSEATQKCIKGENKEIPYDYYRGILDDSNELEYLGKGYRPKDSDEIKTIYFCSKDTSQEGGNTNYKTYKINKHNFILIR